MCRVTPLIQIILLCVFIKMYQLHGQSRSGYLDQVALMSTIIKHVMCNETLFIHTIIPSRVKLYLFCLFFCLFIFCFVCFYLFCFFNLLSFFVSPGGYK